MCTRCSDAILLVLCPTKAVRRPPSCDGAVLKLYLLWIPVASSVARSLEGLRSIVVLNAALRRPACFPGPVGQTGRKEAHLPAKLLRTGSLACSSGTDEAVSGRLRCPPIGVTAPRHSRVCLPNLKFARTRFHLR